MEFTRVIRTRRSVRQYLEKKVPARTLRTVLDAARVAPSGSNRQPTRLIVVREPSLKQALVPLCGGQSFIAQAPVVVVACGQNIGWNRGGYMGDYSMLVDVAIAVDHLTLAARNEGLGTCWIGSFDNEGVKKLLGIPQDVNVVALTPLGYPAQAKAFRTVRGRKKLSEIVATDRWKWKRARRHGSGRTPRGR